MKTIECIQHIKAIGNNRLLYSEQWQATRDYLIQLAKDNGLTVREDAIGNVFLRLEGYDDDKTIGVVSHFDSVENAGAYDGTVGVLGGIEALATLAEKHGKPDVSLEVICIADEEGSRFKTTFIGSRALTGELKYENIERLKDEDGIGFLEAHSKLGYGRLSQEILDGCRRQDIISCLELHIEQSRYLDETKMAIGVAMEIPGQMKVKMTIIGEANHAGTTPMFERKDALCCAAKLISFVEHLGIKYHGITTTGYSINATNATNVIPSKVELIHDIRHHDAEIFNRMLGDLYVYAAKEEEKRGVSIAFEKLVKIEPAQMNAPLRELILTTSKRFDLRSMEMKSGAGHDVQILANAGIPGGLIFIPSKGGISHRPDEYTGEVDIASGVRVLTQVLKKLAYLLM